MSSLTLTRRKSQLELLALVCETRTAARLASPRAARFSAPVQSRFLALQADALLVEWPAQGCGAIPVSGSPVDVAFEHLGQAFTFRTTTCGRAWWSSPGGGQIDAWVLALPLRLQPVQRPRAATISLANLAPVPARCTGLQDPQQTCTAELVDLSDRGLNAIVVDERAGWLRPGITCWTEFELPGENRRFEFVVRVAQRQAHAEPGKAALACTFCPAEDPALVGEQLRRIEHYMAARDNVTRGRAAPRLSGG